MYSCFDFFCIRRKNGFSKFLVEKFFSHDSEQVCRTEDLWCIEKLSFLKKFAVAKKSMTIFIRKRGKSLMNILAQFQGL